MYTSTKTGNTYALNTTWTSFVEAENTCNGYGGHLVAWKSVTEQQEVEGYYLKQGYLLPTDHDNYWLGLNTSAGTWPKFNWTERTVAAPGSGAYQHWGRPEGGVPEPNNNRVGLCGVANASLTYTNAWGWADTVCNMTNVFICRMQREFRALAALFIELAHSIGKAPTCFQRALAPPAADPRSFAPPPAAPLSMTYISPSSGSVFTLNTTALTQAEAQKACNRFGAHLAVYTSSQEQNEVEAYFASNGYLLPTFHKAYWLGLQMRGGSTAFSFLDASIQTTYLNWGLWVPPPVPLPACAPAPLLCRSRCSAARSLLPHPPGPQVPDWRARRELPRAQRPVWRRELRGRQLQPDRGRPALLGLR